MISACRQRRAALRSMGLSGYFCALAMSVFLSLLVPQSAFAQAGAETPAIEEREPSIYLLPIEDLTISDDGPLERVLNFPAESFRQWYKEIYLNRDPKGLPKYSFESVTADITVEGANALIEVAYEVIPRASNWIRIPIGLKGAIPRSPPKVTPEIEVISHPPTIEEAANGYHLWIRVPRKAERPLSPERETSLITLRVKFLVPLSVRGDETSLETSLPPNTKCVIHFEVPQPGAIIAHKGSMVVKEPILDPTAIPATHRTARTMEFAGGNLGLSWRFDGESMDARPPELKVKGQLVATVDVEDTITTVAHLEVESLTTEFDSFEVEIDDSAEFIPQNDATLTYMVRPVDRDGVPFGNRVRVEMDEPTKGPLSVTLHTRQSDPVPGDRGKRQFVLGRFDVLGSRFQEGILSIQAAGNVHVTWDSPPRLREQTGRSSENATARATFAYDHQPATLVLHTLPIQATARVKSKYNLHVGKLDSQLVAQLSYRLPRSYRDDLVIDLNGWNFDNVDTQGATQPQTMEGNSDQLVLPLSSETGGEAMASAPYRTIEVIVRAHREHPMDSPDEVALPWIVPQADPWGTATVAVIPDNAVDVRFLSEKSSGFQLDRSRSQESELGGERGSLVLRASPTSETLALCLKLAPVVPRLIMQEEVTVQLKEGSSQAQVRQLLTYEPFHSSPRKAVLNLPADVFFADVTVAKINGKDVAGNLVEGSDGRIVEYSLADSSPPYRLELQYGMPLQSLEADLDDYRLVLMTPREESLTADGIDVDYKPMSLTFDAPREVEMLTQTESWHAPPSGDDVRQTVRLPGDHSGVVEFSASFLTPRVDERVVVDFHWLQVGLTPERRRDRAVYTLRTAAPRMDIELPPGARNVELYWNGAEIAFARNGDLLQFPIGEISSSSRGRLEIWYDFEPGVGMATSLSVESPEIRNAVLGSSHAGREGGYSYLQVVTPGTWLVLSASGMSEEMDWAWNQGHYNRLPRLTQEQLERLALTNGKSNLPKGMNRFLYSTIGPIKNVHISAAKTSHMILVFSGIALAGLLTLFYFPQTRHVLVYSGAAIVLVGVVLAYPDFAVLVGEMALLGVMLAVLGIALYRLASTRTPVKSAVRARSSDSQAALTSPPSQTPSAAATAMSTASAAAAVSSSGTSR